MRSLQSTLLFFSLLLALMLAACGGRGSETPTPEPTSFTLTVVPSGTGSGTVTAPGISCGTVCAESYPQGTSVTLTATPNTGSTFVGWRGACSGTTCTVVMDSDKAVAATFDQESEGPGPVEPPSEELSGTIQDWVGGTAVLKLETFVGEQYTVLEEVQITPDGAFSLTLPSLDVISRYLNAVESFSCGAYSDEGISGTGPGVEVTPNPLQLGFVYLYVYEEGKSDPIGYLVFGTSAGNTVTFVDQAYAGSGGTITGSCTFSYEDENGNSVSYTDTYNVSLGAGWNNFLTKVTFTGEVPSSYTMSTGSAPAGSAWYYIPMDGMTEPEPPENPEPPDNPEPPVNPEPPDNPESPVNPEPPGGAPPPPPGAPSATGTVSKQLMPHRLFR